MKYQTPMFLLILLITPFILLPNHQPHLPPPNCHIHQSRMSDLNLDTMKQLLAEQAKSLLVEIREQVEAEVRNQVAPHISRINQLEAEQILLKQQLNDLSDQLSQKCYSLPPTRFSSDILNTPEPLWWLLYCLLPYQPQVNWKVLRWQDAPSHSSLSLTLQA